MKKFKSVIITLGQFLGLENFVDNVNEKITIGNTNPTPKGQRINNKSYKEKQQILLYPLLGIDMPKFMVNKLKEKVSDSFNILTNGLSTFEYENRDGGGRTSSFVLSIIMNYVKFPSFEEIEDTDTRELLKELTDSNNQKVYRKLIGKTVKDLKNDYKEIYDLFMNYELTFTVYNPETSDKLISSVFKNINTIAKPTEYTKLATSTQPVAEYIRSKCTPNFNLGINVSDNKDILPLFEYSRTVSKYGDVSVPFKHIQVDGGNQAAFEEGLKMFYACANLDGKHIKPIRQWSKLSTSSIVRYVQEEELSETIVSIFEDNCSKVLELIKELKLLDKNKKIKFKYTPVMIRILLFIILELKSRFNGNFKINSKKFAQKIHNAYVNIQEDDSIINQTQVLNRNDIVSIRSVNSAFNNYAGKEDVRAFAWCVEEMLERILDKTKDDYGLSEIGIIVKDIRNSLTKDMKITIQKAHRNENEKLVSYVTGIEYEDETVLEFSHKVAIGLGKYIFPESTDCVENIVLVERVLNRTMGQMSVEQFKKEYNQNKKAFTQLLKAA